MDIGEFIKEIEVVPAPAFPQEWIDVPAPEPVPVLPDEELIPV